jgi:subtilisin family serine protease
LYQTLAFVVCTSVIMSLTRCASFALLAGSAAGARISKKKGGEKFIAGVPVLNYQDAYKGESLGEFGGEEEWNVVLKQGVKDSQIKKMCAHAKNGCNIVGHPEKGGVPFFEMRGTEQDLEAVIKAGGDLIKFVEPDTTVYAIPELRADQTENGLWGLERVAAYSRSSQGQGVNVFILDTGVRVSHNDFGGRGIPALDMTSGSPVECNGDASCAGDRQGHGTHCAGTAAGTQYGVAPSATVRSVKVLSDQGSGSWSWSYGALDWLAQSSVRPSIASMSLGGSGTQQAMRDAVDAAVNSGVTVIVAGGNSNSDSCNFSPAFVPSAITVGSTDSLSRRSSFSNYGSCTNIWAPGSSILSAGIASDSATNTFSGTSMACPHVAGGAALVLEQNPGFLSAKVLETMLSTARTDELTGLMGGDINKELFVGEGGAPQPAPTPAPAPGSWSVSGSGCAISGSCISSSNHPGNYGNSQSCTISLFEVALTVDAFNTEARYDFLTVGGTAHSGTAGPSAGTYSGVISWATDSSVVTSGWKLCRS